MADPNIVVNMSEALKTRLFPAITRWNRLEGRPRTHNFDRALRAEVRDALWFLSRQWQLGEFQGDDAGSPVLARACIDVMTIDSYQADHKTVESLRLDEPLETRVERRPLPLRSGDQYLSLDLRLLVGRRWLKLLAREFAAGDLSADLRAVYTTLYPVPVPDPAQKAHAEVCAHAETWQQVSAAAGRAMDGIALFEHLANPANHAYDGVGAAAPDEPVLTALAEGLRAWFGDLVGQPPAEGNDAWLPDRLEYQFGLSAQAGENAMVMRAEEYYQGHLDWYALDRRPGETALEPPAEGEPAPAPAAPERTVHTFLPASIVFEGMPNTRWWAFEDRRTNFGEVRPDTTDLGKLLLMEFSLVYANDWFILPYTLPIGHVAEVQGIAISNVFNERLWVEPVRQKPGENWQQWNMFTLAADGAERRPPAPRLVLLPAASKVQESAAVEEVALIRDEMANMVWAIEKRVPLASGWSRPGAETGRELHAFLQRLIGVPAPPPPPAAPIRYQVMNTVPEQWIPFIPVHVPGSVRETQLQRAAMPRILEGDPNLPEKTRPRTSLLAPEPAQSLLHPRGGSPARRRPGHPGVPTHALAGRQGVHLVRRAQAGRARRGFQRSAVRQPGADRDQRNIGFCAVRETAHVLFLNHKYILLDNPRGNLVGYVLRSLLKPERTREINE